MLEHRTCQEFKYTCDKCGLSEIQRSYAQQPVQPLIDVHPYGWMKLTITDKVDLVYHFCEKCKKGYTSLFDIEAWIKHR